MNNSQRVSTERSFDAMAAWPKYVNSSFAAHFDELTLLKLHFKGGEVSKIILDFFATNPGRFVFGEELKTHVMSQLMASIPAEGSA
jgi:hypothetical protein